jgi:hypothetical protein
MEYQVARRVLDHSAWMVVAFGLVACVRPQSSASPSSAPQSSATESSGSQSLFGGFSSVYAGGLGGLQPMPVVPFSEAPPDTGKGWYCFEYRAVDSRDTKTSSTCKRTLQSCRAHAEQRTSSRGGSSRDPIHYEVGTCSKTKTAYCSYLWGPVEGGGAYECHAAPDDCRMLPYTQPGGAVKQSECGKLK